MSENNTNTIIPRERDKAMEETKMRVSMMATAATEMSAGANINTLSGSISHHHHHNNNARLSDLTKLMSPESAARIQSNNTRQEEEEASGALADKLSSSLASIVCTGSRPHKATTTTAGRSSSEENGGSSSSTSHTHGEEGSSGPNTVTATNTTSSGDDRDSSQMATNSTASSSSGGEGRELSFAATTTTAAAVESTLAASGDSNNTATRYHHHHHHYNYHPHHHRQRKRPSPTTAAAADEFGLPVSMDDRVPAQSSSGVTEQHTTVMAHLPPPSTDSTNSSSSGGSGGEGETATLLKSGNNRKREAAASSLSHLEPGLHTIRRTFKKLIGRNTVKRLEIDSSNELQRIPHMHKKASKHSLKPAPPSSSSSGAAAVKNSPKRKREEEEEGSDSSSDDNAGTNGSSSGSGTEGGYAGSASSNDNAATAADYSSPSVSSSSEDGSTRKRTKLVSNGISGDPNRPMLSKKQESNLSVSSELADFSSGASESEVAETMKALREETSSESSSMTSSSNGDGSSDEQEEARRSSKMRARNTSSSSSKSTSESRKRRPRDHPPFSLQVPTASTGSIKPRSRKQVHINDTTLPKPLVGRLKTDCSFSGAVLDGKPPIMTLGHDLMAHVLTFLEPPEILDVLTMPLSKDWLSTFTRQPEMWRVLCLVEPFKAPVDEDSDSDSSDDSLDSFPMKSEPEMRQRFGKFRMRYTSFVRCMRYLARIKDDAVNGRPPSVIDFGASDAAKHNINVGTNQNLQSFLARARGVVVQNRRHPEVTGPLTDSSDDDDGAVAAGIARLPSAVAGAGTADEPITLSDDGCSNGIPRKKRSRRKTDEDFNKVKSKKKKVRYGRSKITDRLLLPAETGEAGHTELPWSCAVYSIVNWMVAFVDVVGIQIMCLKVLPFLFEDEQQRMTAQRAGLTDVVLRGMVMFPDCAALHTAAFHTIVLLARPLGGREGMLFHTSMVNSSGIFSRGAQSGRSGIAVMLDSMRRFQDDELLQAMGCWSLVNIALAPAQKEVLVKLGGIAVTANAMMAHPYNAEVQFRALFALINLVIPSVNLNPNPAEDNQQAAARSAIGETSEREMLDKSVEQIVGLVVLAMKNFCSSEAILNRACLVLHNLSLTQDYHSILLWTPSCYQMLEWTLASYRTDQVLQQSAAGTLHRLQLTLSNDETLRTRFAASLQAQQQQSLEMAHREAILLHEQRLPETKERRQQQPLLP